MSLFLVKSMLGITAGLNSKPAGALSTKVTFVPRPNRVLWPRLRSYSVIGPSVVHAGSGEFAAVSAEMALPPEAGIIFIEARDVKQKEISADTISRRLIMCITSLSIAGRAVAKVENY
jgi:hypothetical protein